MNKFKRVMIDFPIEPKDLGMDPNEVQIFKPNIEGHTDGHSVSIEKVYFKLFEIRTHKSDFVECAGLVNFCQQYKTLANDMAEALIKAYESD